MSSSNPFFECCIHCDVKAYEARYQVQYEQTLMMNKKPRVINTHGP